MKKWSNTNWSPHDLYNLIDKIIKSLNVKIIISEGASENSYSDFIEFQNLNSLIKKEEFLNDNGTFENFKQNIDKTKIQISEILSDLKNRGYSIAGIGASTKGNVMLQYCDLDRSMIECIGEVNEEKVGCFTQGSNIPIIKENDVIDKYEYLLVIPWHFKNFFLNNDKFKGKKLIFALPNVEIIEL